MSEERRIQLVATVDASATREGFNEIGRQAGQMANAVERQGERAEQAVAGIGTGAATTSRSVETAQRSIIASIERTTAAMQAGGRTTAEYYELLARQRGVDPAALTPYLNGLRAVQQAQVSTGQSAAQVANAMRMVPAQLTDIATQLAGGQSPMLILMQQGGQLRDMFGSIPAAARGVGESLMSLISPTTLIVAALGGVVYAYSEGVKQAGAFSRAIIMSGNAAGATKGQLQDLAQQVGKISGSQSAASDALVQLVSGGKVAYGDLREFTMVAVDAQRVLGRDVGTTVAQFSELGKTPLQALAKLTDQTHSISSATYAQVKALQDQGRAAEAAKVAQQAYADATEQQKQKVLDSLTDWERGWLRIKDIVSKTADSIVNIVTAPTDEEQLKALTDRRTAIEANLARAQQLNAKSNIANLKEQLDANAALIAPIRARMDAQKAAAKATADATAIDEARNKWLDEGDKYLSRVALRERDLTRARNEGAAAHKSQVEIDKRLADIRKSYSDIYNGQIDAQIAKLEGKDRIEEIITQREIARIAALRAAGALTEDDAINQTADADIASINRQIEKSDAEIDLAKKKADSYKQVEDLNEKIGQLKAQRTSREEKRDQDIAALEQRRYRQAVGNWADLMEKDMAEKNSLIQQTQAQLDYNDAIGLTTKQVAQLTAARMLEQAARKEADAITAEGQDLSGQRAATFREEAAAIRERAAALVEGADKQQRYDSFKRAVDQYDQVFQQGFADMINTGEAGWHSFTKSLVTTFKTSVADQLYKMFARPFVVQLVGSFVGMSNQVIAGEIAAGAPMLGGAATNAGSLIGAAQAASNLYGFATGGMTLAGGVGTGFVGSLSGGLMGAGAGAGLESSIGLSIGSSISSVVGPTISSALASGLGAVATALPWIGAAAAAFALGKAAFGMGDKNVTSTGLRGSLSSMGLTGESYSNWHQDGGWFRSDRNGTDTSAFSADINKQFTQGFQSIEDAAATFAKSIGASTDSLTGYSKTFDIALGKDQAANQKAITDFFSGLSDDIAKKLVPNLDDFTKSGETASAALQRLAGDFDATNTMAQMLGKSALSVFGSLGIDSAGARERIVGLFGGTQALSQLTGSYAQNYLTDAERLRPVQEALDAAMKSLGLSSVTTRDQFKGVIDSLDLTTEAGAQEFASLMKLADAFAQVHPQVDATADAAKNAADAFEAMKNAAAGLYGDVDNAFSALQKVAAREKAAIQKTVDAHQAAVNRLLGLSQAVHSAFDSYKTPEQKRFDRAAAQAEIRADLAIMKAGGVLSDLQTDSLKKALGNATQDSSGQFSSYTDYLRDIYKTQIDIASLGDVSDQQLSVEQQALKAAQDQLDAIDAMLANAQDQIDVLKGQSTTLLSIEDAIRGLSLAILGAQSNPIIGATAAINEQYQKSLGRAPDAAGLAFYQGQAAKGVPISDIRNGIATSSEATIRGLYQLMLGGRDPSDMELNYWLGQVSKGVSLASVTDAIANSAESKRNMGIPGFASGGDFLGGLRIVGERGPELEATGPARIFSASQTAAMLTRLAVPVADNRELVQELRDLKAEMVPALQRIVSYTNRTAVTNEDMNRREIEAQDATA